MFRPTLRTAHFSRFVFGLAILLFQAGSCASAADVVLIEEHWELHVGGPDAARSAPQVTMVMSPTSDIEDDFFLVTLNHWSYPDYAAGGIQVQRWHQDECYDVAEGSEEAPLADDAEVISWVQRISWVDGNLKFEVVNGNSESWGTFGNSGELSLTQPTALTRLNAYRPAVSIEQSGIGYAGNRVSSLVLKRIQWQTVDGVQHEMVAPIDIATDFNP